MRRLAAIFLAISFAIIGYNSFASAESFECAFIQDKYPSGKSNKASCSMTPERVFSSRNHTPKKGDHCMVEGVYEYEDYVDFLVDSVTKTVTWTRRSGLTEDAKPRHKAYLIKKGSTDQEAEADVQQVHVDDNNNFRIVSHVRSTTRIRRDEVTRKRLKPPREVPEHHFTLMNSIYLYYLYIPEASGDAILIEPTGSGGASWINIRFGKCRRTN